MENWNKAEGAFIPAAIKISGHLRKSAAEGTLAKKQKSTPNLQRALFLTPIFVEMFTSRTLWSDG